MAGLLKARASGGVSEQALEAGLARDLRELTKLVVQGLFGWFRAVLESMAQRGSVVFEYE
jgi:hypothetical protein